MRAFALVLLFAATGCATSAQTPAADSSSADPVAQVRQTIESLFDGMRAGDSTAVRATFSPEARFHSVAPAREGEGYRLIEGSADRFVEAVGTPHDEVWDERVGEIDIRVDAGLATAWMAYRFYLGDTFSHCGVNAMHLVNVDGAWRILNLVDTRRTGCE